MPQHRVVIATDIPFWLQANGAQQRMSALAQLFRREPFDLIVFYLGHSSNEILTLAAHQGIKLELFQRETTSGIFSSAWATLDRLRGKSRGAVDVPRDTTLTINDYAWPSAMRQFTKMVRRLAPQAVIFEYVTMSFLAPVVREAAPRARLILDSHDVLHRRCSQFKAAGYQHWLQITEQEEIDAVKQFDVILAIQDEEAQWFRHAAPQSKVLTVGHCFDFSKIQPAWRDADGGPAIIGYFGSHNGSNVDAVNNFVNTVWPIVVQKSEGPIELLLGGTIVDSPLVTKWSSVDRVRTQRDFPSPGAFYQSVDLVINPVRFGTGLKIKTVEALAHGRPVVTTADGRIGVAEAFESACVAVDSVDKMVDPIIELVRDRSFLTKVSQSAYAMAQVEFSQDAILGELRQLLLSESELSPTKWPHSSQKMLE